MCSSAPSGGEGVEHLFYGRPRPYDFSVLGKYRAARALPVRLSNVEASSLHSFQCPNRCGRSREVESTGGQVSEGTLRNWRCMRVGPSFLNIGKAIHYPSGELDRWDKSNLVVLQTHTRTAAGKGGTARVAERQFSRSEVAG